MTLLHNKKRTVTVEHEDSSSKKVAKNDSDKLFMSCKQWSWTPQYMVIIQMCSICHASWREMKGTPNLVAKLCTECLSRNYAARFPDSPPLKPFVPIVEEDDSS